MLQAAPSVLSSIWRPRAGAPVAADAFGRAVIVDGVTSRPLHPKPTGQNGIDGGTDRASAVLLSNIIG
jgi:hypothetical protein